MRYFAYGSNMDPVQMAARCPDAHVVATARLPGHRVAFVNDPSGFDGGVATIVPDDAEDVWGVVWEIDDIHLQALDEWEAYPLAYDRRPISVFTPEPVDALIYIATMTNREQPNERYFGGIMRGARENGLPQEYVERLERWSRE